MVAAVFTNCCMRALALSSLPSIVLNATSNCWNSPRTCAIFEINSFAVKPAPNAAAALVIRLNSSSIPKPLCSICLDVFFTPFSTSRSLRKKLELSPVMSKCIPAIGLFDRNSSVQHHTALQI